MREGPPKKVPFNTSRENKEEAPRIRKQQRPMFKGEKEANGAGAYLLNV